MRDHLLLLLLAFGIVASNAAGSPAQSSTWEAGGYGAKVYTDPTQIEGLSLQCDLPKSLHMKNCGGSDGSGLCVFTSINHSAYWQNVPQLQKFQEWMKRHPGGGYPEKVDRTIAQMCKENNVTPPQYLQIETSDLDILKLACKTGRMPGITYSFSPSGRYGGARIAHMVTLLHIDDKAAVILDNNFPHTYEVCSIDEFRRSYTGGGKTGWAVILLNPGPPPVPTN